MNYITHLEGVHQLFIDDERITPFHVCLYQALFHCWNHAKYPAKLSINRAEMMRNAKLGSSNTYLKCLKELDQFGYLKYEPSRNPYKASFVSLFTFDTSSEQVVNKSRTTTKQVSNNSNTSSEQVVIPYLNNINYNKHIKQSKTIVRSNNNSSKEKRTRFSPPKIEEVEIFFSNQKSTTSEAQKFFNHFESNGWLVSGKTPMKNWQAAARNWMINSKKFNPPSPGQILSSEQNKSYNIPL
jgi:hypothetical protein